MDSALLNRVPGGSDLIAWFGYAPRFHDAEVLSLALDREGPTCTLRIHVFEMTSEVDERGYFVCAKDVVATFVVGGLSETTLTDFGHQNVLTELLISQDEVGAYRLTLDGSYGLSGVVVGTTLNVSLQPGLPPEASI